ncbi:hypothetical protein [Sediminibacillus albus]|uniref:Histidine kinase-, DNA gyrase B-, and HSP90-like ATPase n=1 Tax=Sediminibacillus albus TaxID=407036 RepID=A0A1G9BEX9_9BACI|nr:hypothetical protein [Sediminibacillus albus]SDK38027.1 hypothetical protein SAMN05216243_2985 [Sediminibacillus albus]
MITTTGTDIKNMAIHLATCESEKEVIDFLKEKDLWGSKHWRSYGDNENNFSVIGNQQSSPDAALVEKLINSVDAVLMKECFINGVDPTSDFAPKDVDAALSTFFQIPEGKLSNLDSRERTKLAENINFVATGKKSKPNYTIIDKGEGQSPKGLPDTILSLNKSNKLRIPFVQGKFNMGGSGVLQFCGDNNLQLVISKRHPQLSKDDSSQEWGVTVVRREPPTKGKRSSVYTYLAPGGNILGFKADELELLPSKDSAFGEALEYGTFIKLFEYKVPGLTTNILFDLYNRLSMLMPTLAMPIRFYERRDYKGHTLETTLSGLNVRLTEDKRSNIEEGFPLSSRITIKGQEMKLSIIAFKEGKEEKYKKGEGIIFTVNGQTHGDIPKAFFTRKSVGMGALANSLLTIVDCTQLDGRSREDLFMNSRDRLREGELRKLIEDELSHLVKNHAMLKSLREKRRKEALANKLSDDKPLTNLLDDIMKKSPTLSKLFISGQRLSNPFNLEKTGETEDYQGKEFPTFFKLRQKGNKFYTRTVPKNVRARIPFETDATNDYFDRSRQPGEATLLLNGERVGTYNINLHNGVATLNVRLPDGAKVNEEYTYTLVVTDESRYEPFQEIFKLVAEEDKKNTSNDGKGKRKKGSGSNDKKTREEQSKLALPNIFEITREDWEKKNFNNESALKVENNGESGYDFHINMDNIHLTTELKSRSQDVELIKNKYKYGMVLIGLGIINGTETEEDDEDPTNKVEETTRMISPMLIPMIENLGGLQEDDI